MSISVVVSETDATKPRKARVNEGARVGMSESSCCTSHSARVFRADVAVCYKCFGVRFRSFADIGAASRLRCRCHTPSWRLGRRTLRRFSAALASSLAVNVPQSSRDYRHACEGAIRERGTTGRFADDPVCGSSGRCWRASFIDGPSFVARCDHPGYRLAHCRQPPPRHALRLWPTGDEPPGASSLGRLSRGLASSRRVSPSPHCAGRPAPFAAIRINHDCTELCTAPHRTRQRRQPC
jgi:hypothetical protein